MYVLERLTRQGVKGHPRYVTYGISADRRLLERVRDGQKRPDDWRVAELGRAGMERYLTTWRKAG